MFANLAECEIYSQDLVQRLNELLLGPSKLASKVAVVTASALQRMQARRMIGGTHFSYFDNAEDALRWLETLPD
jgi:hypothetical protein